MSKFLKHLLFAVLLPLGASQAFAQGDAEAGKAAFKKCAVCHKIGPKATNAVGPQLNHVFGRTAGTAEGFKYSDPMRAAGNGGLVWSEATLPDFLKNPSKLIKGTRMGFAGLKNDEELANVIAYLKTFSGEADKAQTETPVPRTQAATQAAAPQGQDADTPVPTHGVFHLGRIAAAEEITAWDIDVSPDGTGLPAGRGTVSRGEELFTEQCASCHGDFGEGAGRWPMLAGGQDTLTAERPEKTIGSYWPYLSTVYDYVHRAMPFGNARSLSNDDVYALVAYLLYLNDVVTDETFELSNENFTEIELPNVENFIDDDRTSEPHYADKSEPCMSNCKLEPARVTMRARVLDVTPEAGDDDNAGAGSVD